MYRYRVLNKSTNTYLDERKVTLAPNGTLSIGIFEKPMVTDIQPYIHVMDGEETPIYIGDALGLKINQDDEEKEVVDRILEYHNIMYRPNNYDELLIQIEKNGLDQMHYWVMFKINGELIKNKDCSHPSGVLTTQKT